MKKRRDCGNVPDPEDKHPPQETHVHRCHAPGHLDPQFAEFFAQSSLVSIAGSVVAYTRPESQIPSCRLHTISVLHLWDDDAIVPTTSQGKKGVPVKAR